MRRYPQDGASRAISSTSARTDPLCWTAGRTARIGPVLLNEVGMPAQQGPRGDDEPQLAELAAGQQPGQRGQDRPVSLFNPGAGSPVRAENVIRVMRPGGIR